LVTTAALHPTSDYIGYASADGEPTIMSSFGPYAEWCSAKAIHQANRLAQSAEDRQEVTRYLYSRVEDFRVRLIRLPVGLERPDVQFRVDGQEDWEHIQVIYDALGHEEWDWTRLARLLDRHSMPGQPVGGIQESAA
jgi:spore coat polysaccharide biosynthesis protein SpsF (cytidylyltransferase family)